MFLVFSERRNSTRLPDSEFNDFYEFADVQFDSIRKRAYDLMQFGILERQLARRVKIVSFVEVTPVLLYSPLDCLRVDRKGSLDLVPHKFAVIVIRWSDYRHKPMPLVDEDITPVEDYIHGRAIARCLDKVHNDSI